jgi:ribosomal-protein-alanine N-acetyltransferase
MSYSSASIALHGPTLTLRPPGAGDVPALFELAADPDVTRWFSWGPYTSLDEPRAYVERVAGQRERGEQLDLLVVHRERGPAGITGLSEFSWRDQRCVVGTWFGRAFWGTGANRESKAIVAHLAFAVLGMHRLGSYSNPANVRSTRALLAIGFRHEGVLRDWHSHDGRHHDVNVFGLLREEWEAGPLRDVPVRVDGALPASLRGAGLSRYDPAAPGATTRA